MKTFNRQRLLAGAMAWAVAGVVHAGAVDALLADYAADGAGPFSAEAGAAAWTAEHRPEGEAPRSCADCHGTDLTRPGEHVRTGKRIAPLAPSANAERLSEAREIRKWLYRNCKWTLGRECSAQEKGDFLVFLRGR